MSTLLQINSSLFSEHGVSSELAEDFVGRWLARHPEGRVIRRDLAAAPVPYLDAERLGALSTPAEQRTLPQRRIVAEADALIAELQSADVLVLGLPMYNFSMPAQLKSWFDHIARAGVTFRYTPEGPRGLLEGKRAVIFASSGGRHRDQPQDHAVPLARTLLGFVGIDDVEVVYAEGLNMGETPRRLGLDAARARIEQLLAA